MKFIIILICLFFTMGNMVWAADPPLPTPVGRVVWVKGTLKAEMTNNEVRMLQKTSVIYLSDVLTTDKASQAQIAFTDNTLMTFSPETRFIVEQYRFRSGNKKGSVGKYVMRLLEGGFRTITGLIAKQNPSDYQVNTPVATIGVRGTDYAVFIRNSQVYVGYYAGEPCVSNLKGKKLCLSQKVPYALVPAADVAPVPLTEQPDVFREKLNIIPAKIDLFTSDNSGNGGSSSSSSSSNQTNRSGVVTSFCIQ